MGQQELRGPGRVGWNLLGHVQENRTESSLGQTCLRFQMITVFFNCVCYG